MIVALNKKNILLMGVALLALTLGSRPAAAACGVGILNGNGGQDYTISGAETTDCALDANDTLLVKNKGSLIVEDTNAVSLLGADVGSIVNNGRIETKLSSSFAGFSANQAAVLLNANTAESVINNASGIMRSRLELSAGMNYVGLEGYGILMDNVGAPVASGVSNHGLIDVFVHATGEDDGYAEGNGILGANGSGASMVENTGRIIVNASSVNEEYAAAEANGIHLRDVGSYGGILNSGTISVTSRASTVSDGFYAISRGIWTEDVAVTADIVNTGSVELTMTGEGSVGELYGRGINLRDDTNMTGNLINEGFVMVDITSSDYGSGVGVYVDEAVLDGDFINEGSIRSRVTALSGSSYGVRFNDSSVTGSLINRGNIYAESSDPAIDNYGIRISDMGFAGGIVNYGNISAGSGTAIFLDGLTSATPIYIEEGSRIIGHIFDNDANSGYSTIYVNADASTAGDYTVSDLVVDGGRNFRIAAGDTVTLSGMTASTGGTFSFGVNSAADTGKMFVTNGNGLDFTGATIAAYVQNGAGLSVGDEFMVAKGDDSIVGGVTGLRTAIADNSYLFSFEVANGTAATIATDDTEVYMFVTQADTVSSAALGVNRGIAAVVDDQAGSLDPEFMLFVDNVYNAPTQAALNDVLSSAAPTTDTGSQAAAIGMMGDLFDLADGQLAMVNTHGGTGVSSGDHPMSGLHYWAQGFGGVGDQGARGGVAGYDVKTYGLALGVDTRNLRDDTTVGISFGYGDTRVKSDNVNRTKTDIDTYQLMLYANHDLQNNVFLTGMAAASYGDNDQVRHNVGGVPGTTAQGDYDTWTAGLRAAVGRNYYVDNGLKLAPQVFTEYTHFYRESYSETGAGGLNLTNDSANQDILNLGVSLQVEKNIALQDGSSLKPDVHVSYKYDVLDDKTNTTSSFAAGGGTFSTGGLDPANSTFSAGAGLKLAQTNGWDFTVNYDYTHKEDFDAHSGFLRAGYEF